ncbi:hypothetical protein [Pseudomonas aeruginosa]|uniref:hypothetical protein n=1 Tax=Pseudomonas aeruginosa TaxID=287 RepID=UPI000EB60CA0|nr:hypothetical protein [Pseudomonas aeruginosa]
MQIKNGLYRQTVLRGIVKQVVDRGVSYDEDYQGHMDSNPDRTDFQIDVIEGPADLFIEWFDVISGCHIVRYGAGAGFSEIGASQWTIQEGALIELSFDQFFEASIGRHASYARNKIHYDCHKALKSLSQTWSNS